VGCGIELKLTRNRVCIPSKSGKKDCKPDGNGNTMNEERKYPPTPCQSDDGYKADPGKPGTYQQQKSETQQQGDSQQQRETQQQGETQPQGETQQQGDTQQPPETQQEPEIEQMSGTQPQPESQPYESY